MMLFILSRPKHFFLALRETPRLFWSHSSSTVLVWQVECGGSYKFWSAESGLGLLLNIQYNMVRVQVKVCMCGVPHGWPKQQHLETEEEMGSSVLIHSAELSSSHKFLPQVVAVTLQAELSIHCLCQNSWGRCQVSACLHWFHLLDQQPIKRTECSAYLSHLVKCLDLVDRHVQIVQRHSLFDNGCVLPYNINSVNSRGRLTLLNMCSLYRSDWGSAVSEQQDVCALNTEFSVLTTSFI